ncbi:MAG: hypothetical protein L0H59_13605, partial [Tomitella sp.]|nr:hypothetical protein [Tomitella sp.]
MTEGHPAARGRPHYAMLTNPYSGHGRARDVAERAGVRLRASGAAITELSGDDADDALDLARRAVAEAPDALIATGGDGLKSDGDDDEDSDEHEAHARDA